MLCVSFDQSMLHMRLQFSVHAWVGEAGGHLYKRFSLEFHYMAPMAHLRLCYILVGLNETQEILAS